MIRRIPFIIAGGLLGFDGVTGIVNLTDTIPKGKKFDLVGIEIIGNRVDGVVYAASTQVNVCGKASAALSSVYMVCTAPFLPVRSGTTKFLEKEMRPTIVGSLFLVAQSVATEAGTPICDCSGWLVVDELPVSDSEEAITLLANGNYS